jgi:hypothetical protein
VNIQTQQRMPSQVEQHIPWQNSNYYYYYYVMLISLLLFLFAAQTKEFFLDGLKKLEQRSHKYVELRGNM